MLSQSLFRLPMASLQRVTLRMGIAALLCLVLWSTASACPFCPAPTLTLSEQLTQSDAAVLVEWVSAFKGDLDANDASTTYRIKQVLKGPLKAGELIKQVGYQPGEPGRLFLLTGLGTGVIEWDLPAEFTMAAYEYLAAAPAPTDKQGQKVPARERLPFFVTYLENPDQTISNDAFGEFSNAEYEEIAAVRGVLPRERIHNWVFDEQAPIGRVSRLGLYGLLLGLSGNETDAADLERLIAKPTTELRIGIDGITSGYLLLRGEKGLDLVEQLKLKNENIVDKNGQPVVDNDGEKLPVPFSETYAALQAIRFMWNYGNGQISVKRLQSSMSLLLDRPELADIAIADLARWKDWSVEAKLFALYNDEAYKIPAIQRSIIRYFLAATKDQPMGVTAETTPAHVKSAEEYLAKIEKQDPAMVAEVKQFLIVVP